jgi:hypothetical protein
MHNCMLCCHASLLGLLRFMTVALPNVLPKPAAKPAAMHHCMLLGTIGGPYTAVYLANISGSVTYVPSAASTQQPRVGSVELPVKTLVNTTHVATAHASSPVSD